MHGVTCQRCFVSHMKGWHNPERFLSPFVQAGDIGLRDAAVPVGAALRSRISVRRQWRRRWPRCRCRRLGRLGSCGRRTRGARWRRAKRCPETLGKQFECLVFGLRCIMKPNQGLTLNVLQDCIIRERIPLYDTRTAETSIPVLQARLARTRPADSLQHVMDVSGEGVHPC